MTEPQKEIITKLGLKELLRIYDSEMDRQTKLDSKAASVLGFASIVVTILLFNIKFFLDNPDNMSIFYFYWISISIIIITLSLISLMYSIRVRNYKNPVPYNKLDDLRSYLTIYPEENLKEEMLNRYGDCIRINHGENDRKAYSFQLGVILLSIGVLVALFSTFIFFLG